MGRYNGMGNGSTPGLWRALITSLATILLYGLAEWWQRLGLRAVADILAYPSAWVTGVGAAFWLLEWIVYTAGARMHEIAVARTAGAVNLAQALKGLTEYQTEAVMAGERVAMQLIPGDDEPVLFVRGLTRNIPWAFVETYLQHSQQTDPFLWPIREATNEAFATDLTNLIVARGWADKARGPLSAKLTRPLAWVAKRFWVELEGDSE